MTGLTVGTLIAGKYRLVERLSDGGMGSVWRAHNLQLDARVALKFMLSDLVDSDEARRRFEREAKAAARIGSAHVVTVHDHGIDPTLRMPFIVMELLQGRDLGKRLSGGKRLAPEEVLRICRQIGMGLRQAHDLGIVHRDLKLANVFLCKADGDMVKILDFGIAKEVGRHKMVVGEATGDGQVLGSPHYMSPEQVRGAEIDPRTDLWALSVIAYRALTGVRPYDGDRMNELVAKIVSEMPHPPSHWRPELPPAVDAFFVRAFARDIEDRFATADELVAAFDAALTRAPVQVVPAAQAPVAPAPATSIGDDPSADAASASLPKPKRELLMVPTPMGPAPNPDKTSPITALGIGVAIAVAVILVVGGNPGDISLDKAIRRFEDVTGIRVRSVPTASASASASPAPTSSAMDLSDLDAKAHRAWRRLYTQVRTGETPRAVETFAELLKLDPEAPDVKRATMVELGVQAIERGGPVKTRMIGLMKKDMGVYGPDLAFDIVATRPGTPAAHEAKGMLRDAAFRMKGSQDMQLAYAIEVAGPCRARGPALAAKAKGGDRTLRTLEGLVDCASTEKCCLSADPAVKATLTAIKSRL